MSRPMATPDKVNHDPHYLDMRPNDFWEFDEVGTGSGWLGLKSRSRKYFAQIRRNPDRGFSRFSQSYESTQNHRRRGEN